MKQITMYNPRTKVYITTTEKFKEKWENLGFFVQNNILLFRMAS